MGLPYDLIWLAVPLYVALQAVALARPESRMAAAVPLAVMVPLFAFSAVALTRGSNLWPLPLLFATPPAALLLAAVLLLSRRGGVTRTA
jgi:hypothetical protein